jgi:hypothetical protein
VAAERRKDIGSDRGNAKLPRVVSEWEGDETSEGTKSREVLRVAAEGDLTGSRMFENAFSPGLSTGQYSAVSRATAGLAARGTRRMSTARLSHLRSKRLNQAKLLIMSKASLPFADFSEEAESHI